jgi:hypothetical protein
MQASASGIESQVVESGFTLLEHETAKRVAEGLNTKYPGHLWAVNITGPIIDIRDLYLSGDWGFRLDSRSFFSASEMDKQIMRAGGELLEHYKQRRGLVDDAAINTLQTNFAGRHKPEL